MRQFRLYNATGESYDLNDLDFFFENPEGLGAVRATTYRQIGGRFVPQNDTLSQTPIKGQIGFKDPNAYDKYFSFMLFAAERPLRLDYTPNNITYSIDCYMQVIEKTELDLRGLTCPVEFRPLSPFYRLLSSESSEGGSSDGKVYDYTYPYTYAESTPGTSVLESNTKEESPCRIIIFGPLINPRWTYYNNGVLKASGALTGSIPDGHRLVISTMNIPYSIEEQDPTGNVIRDLYGSADFETERFVHFQKGTNRVSIGHEGTNTPRLIVEARLYYDSV